MYYTYQVTTPVKINSIETYRHRITQILSGQIKNAVDPIKFKNPIFWALFFLAIPMTLIFIVLGLLEIVIDTILLPLSLIPIVRVIPIGIEAMLWGLEMAIGYFSATDLVYYV